MSNFRHGHKRNAARSREYVSWQRMISRCTNPADRLYREYGDRGISVSEEWRVFANFLRDMGEKPSASHSIDRIDNEAGYSKENCRWSTKDVQNHNKRPVSNTGHLGVSWREGRGCFCWSVTRSGLTRRGTAKSLDAAVAAKNAATQLMYGGVA